MNKYTLYTYDLWADGDDGYSVNDVYTCETVKAESFDDAIKQLDLKMDMVEEDNNVDAMNTIYFNYKKGKYSGSPAFEIRQK